MVFIKKYEARKKAMQEERERKLEIEQNRLSDTDVPWMKYECAIFEGYLSFI